MTPADRCATNPESVRTIVGSLLYKAASHAMTPLIILGAFFGSCITWAVTKYFYEEKMRAYLRETTAQNDVQHHFYVTRAITALGAMESGDSESAKRELACGAAGFYFSQFPDSEQPEWIQAQKREVELLAKSSRVLRETLEAQKNDNTASYEGSSGKS
jgi:hypothetical protein